MAEKRAKDRVILKLIGLHGLAYSEEEADDFKQEPAKEPPAKPVDDGRAKLEQSFKTIRQNLLNAPHEAALENVWSDSEADRKKLPPEGQAALLDIYHQKKAQAA
jgi:hypothetical protein